MQTIHVDAMEDVLDRGFYKVLCGLVVKERYVERLSLARMATCTRCLALQREMEERSRS